MTEDGHQLPRERLAPTVVNFTGLQHTHSVDKPLH